MKKRLLSSILLSAAVVPCAFVMAACGGSQLDSRATVDKGGRWEASSHQAMSTYVAGEGEEEVQTSITSKGYHFTMESTGTPMGDMFVNGFIKLDEDGKGIESSLKMESTIAGQEMSVSYWVKDGVLYSSTIINNGEPIRVKQTLGEYGADQAILEEAGDSIMLTAEDYVEMFDQVEAAGNIGKVAFDVSTQGSTKKFRAKLTEEILIEDSGMSMKNTFSECYIIFENNAFVGASYESKGTLTMNETTTDTVSYFAITQFDGDIAFPNFEDFTLGF